MIKTYITLAILLACSTTFCQQNFYYKISVKPTQARRLFIAYEIAGIIFIDSVNIVEKQYNIYKKLSQPVAATLFTNDKKVNPIPVFLANNSLQVAINKTVISVNNTKQQSDFLMLTANDRIRPNYFPLYGELNATNDTAGLQQLSVVFDSLKKDDIKKAYNYFTANTTSKLSLFSFSRYAAFFADYSTVERDFALLPRWAKNSPDGKNIVSKMEGAKSVQVNTKARNFSQTSTTGQTIHLESFKGKYVLLDFWASWCAPCRKEHPDFIIAYNQYKTKNFEIISISLDDNKTSWLTAIEKDKIYWTNLSDLKGQQNDIALKYGVQAIPASFLIDPNGIIIDKNLDGEALLTKLKTLLDK